ncbi:MAG: response regulator, partial [Campylobacterota bacterium]
MLTDINNSVLDYLKSSTLLCVEDSKSTQLIYRALFEDLVKKVVCASNGKEGYEKFCKEDIDLIVCDYNMPILNGIEMIRKIRNIDKDIPIILISSIEDVDVIVQALQLNVSNFLKKPIVTTEVMQSIENVSKLLIANNYIKEQSEKKLKELEKKEEYNSYQEDLAFSKELNILRNDFYYQMLDNQQCFALIDFFYKPLDVLSGDAYSARKISDDKVFYFIVDGMGKGLSASLSSMLMTSFVNHIIDKSLDSFDFRTLLEASLEYIKPILLDEEALSIDFIVIDHKELTMEYAKFAMPPSLAQNADNEIIKIKSNNPPMCKYTKEVLISTVDISKTIKFLFYSDGVVENSVRYDNKLYMDFIEEDFLLSFTKDEFREKLLWKIDTQEDDMTFVFINQLTLNSYVNHIKRTFESTLDAVDEANDWYADIWSNFTNNYKLSCNAGVVFTELFMNAYEHGNLGIDSETKHRLLEEDNYFTTLEMLQKKCDKQITVTVNTIEYSSRKYITTLIKDEGIGFDTQILSKIFRNKKNFNGRGVYVSRQSS